MKFKFLNARLIWMKIVKIIFHFSLMRFEGESKARHGVGESFNGSVLDKSNEIIEASSLNKKIDFL